MNEDYLDWEIEIEYTEYKEAEKDREFDEKEGMGII
jgi:hypothetical protein